MRDLRMILKAVMLAGSLGIVAAASALPAHITVTTATHMDIIRDGQVSGKMSLKVGTALDVDGVTGEYVLVRIRLLKGRVPAKDTDFAAQNSGAQDEPQPAQASASVPAAKPSPSATSATSSAKPSIAPPAYAVPARPAAPPPAAPALPPLDRRPPSLGVAPRLFLLTIIVATIASYWLLFTKAGKPGWASVVPVYNLVVLMQISGKPVWWIILYFIPIVNVIMAVLCGFGIAERFGKDKAFGLGIALLPWVFVPILVFADDSFSGAPGAGTGIPKPQDGAEG